MKIAYSVLVLAALSTPVVSAAQPKDDFCNIVGVFSSARGVEGFTKPLRDADYPLVMWKDGVDFYVAVGPYDSKVRAEAVSSALLLQKVTKRSNRGVVVNNCSQIASQP